MQNALEKIKSIKKRNITKINKIDKQVKEIESLESNNKLFRFSCIRTFLASIFYLISKPLILYQVVLIDKLLITYIVSIILASTFISHVITLIKDQKKQKDRNYINEKINLELKRGKLKDINTLLNKLEERINKENRYPKYNDKDIENELNNYNNISTKNNLNNLKKQNISITIQDIVIEAWLSFFFGYIPNSCLQLIGYFTPYEAMISSCILILVNLIVPITIISINGKKADKIINNKLKQYNNIKDINLNKSMDNIIDKIYTIDKEKDYNIEYEESLYNSIQEEKVKQKKYNLK